MGTMLYLVVAARPNLMKAAPLCRALARHQAPYRLVHTGQHYDANMSDVFFEGLGIPPPDHHLGIGSGSHAEQTGKTLMAFERLLRVEDAPGAAPCSAVVVFGDVNATVACALAAVKLEIPVVHVEAGLRSGDRSMPEEWNRLLTDRMSTLLLTPSVDADENLRREGVPPEQVTCVGNIMIDTLRREEGRSRAAGLALLATLGHEPKSYGVVTLHRPSNVDDGTHLQALWSVLTRWSQELPLLFPVHPRTRARLDFMTLGSSAGLTLLDPLGYHEFAGLIQHARVVLTDSGGIQEETTVYGVPCLTLRENTERPVTVSVGTNTLVGTDPARIEAAMAQVLSGTYKTGAIPPLWDGHTAERIVALLSSRRFSKR